MERGGRQCSCRLSNASFSRRRCIGPGGEMRETRPASRMRKPATTAGGSMTCTKSKSSTGPGRWSSERETPTAVAQPSPPARGPAARRRGIQFRLDRPHKLNGEQLNVTRSTLPNGTTTQTMIAANARRASTSTTRTTPWATASRGLKVVRQPAGTITFNGQFGGAGSQAAAANQNAFFNSGNGQLTRSHNSRRRRRTMVPLRSTAVQLTLPATAHIPERRMSAAERCKLAMAR